MKHNKEQLVAINRIVDHVELEDDPFMVLEGPAGTGKTACMKEVDKRLEGKRIIYTSTTNKATRILKDSLFEGQDTCTIHKLLSLVVLPKGEIKTLSGKNQRHVADYDAVVIDEGSMVCGLLNYFIQKAADDAPSLKWIILGDRWQLPPVGERLSPVWDIEKRAELTKVMRNDSQILRLATHVRGLIQTPGRLVIEEDQDGKGVWIPKEGILNKIRMNAGEFKEGISKAVAWKNVTVDAMNLAIRRELLENADKSMWQIGERLSLLEPAKNLEGDIVATTDTEGIVLFVYKDKHPVFTEFLCYIIDFHTDEGQVVTLRILHESAYDRFNNTLKVLADNARTMPSKWKDYWAFKESFNLARHAYATTVHRSQGSTYDNCYVNWRDIMLNRNKTEALRCLYVATSRPRYNLYMG